MERSRWVEAARRVARELPEEARVIVLLRPSTPGIGTERAIIELATEFARRRPRVLLIDLGASAGPLCRALGGGAAGLREVLRGRATAVETAVRVRERGFMYLPPGRPEASEPAADPALRALIGRAKAGGATTLLCGVSAPHRLGDVADGIVPIEAEAGARTRPTAPAAPEEGVTTPSEPWSAARLLAPEEAAAEPDPPGSRLPAALPYSTFSIGAALRPLPFLDSAAVEPSAP